MAKRILLVEAEKTLAHFLSLELQKEGFQVDTFLTASESVRAVKEKDYDLYLLGYHLPDMTFLDLAQKIAAIRSAAVIIVMAYPEDVLDEGEAIQKFAVASVRKPVIIPQLVDQIAAIFRGRDFIDQHCSQMKISHHVRNLRIDTVNHLVYRGDELIALTRREYDLLATLMSSKDVLSREQLLDRVWKYESTTETNVVDVYIRYLRGKIDQPDQRSYIKTVRGVGYTIDDSL